MKSRTVFVSLAAAFVGLLGVSLLAQPNDQRRDDGKFELTIPPGSYSAFVFTCLEAGAAKRLIVGIEGRQEFCSFAVPNGETVILPVGVGDKAYVLKRALQVKISDSSTRVQAFGVSTEGRIPFRPD